MIKGDSLNFLEKLISTISPSGFEHDAVSLWSSYVKRFVSRVGIDVNGNGIALCQGEGNRRVMLAAHIDEIGYMVKYIDREGFLYFAPIGGVDPHLIPGQRVWIKTKKGRITGVIGRKPIHLISRDEERKVAKIEDMFIDIGAKSEKEAKKRISVGDCLVPAVALENLYGDIFVARGFDDKAGVFVMSEVLKKVSQQKLKFTLYGVATTQEEIGLRGARTSSYDISPDIALVIEVTFATDFPGIDKRKVGQINLGGGPVIARGPNIHPEIFDLLVRVAEKNNISYQIEAIERPTGTDANIIQITKSGVKTGLLSIPIRYMHTAVELINAKDLEGAIRLITAFLKVLQ